MSRLSDAAFEYMRRHHDGQEITTDELWRGMKSAFPELTAVTGQRKTPRNTLMRDIRLDRLHRFEVENRRVRLKP